MNSSRCAPIASWRGRPKMCSAALLNRTTCWDSSTVMMASMADSMIEPSRVSRSGIDLTSVKGPSGPRSIVVVMNASIHPCGEPLIVDPELLRKYGGAGPRYTSYPTADRFVEGFDAAAYRHWLGQRDIGGFKRALGLYVHVPFCDTLCFYCACNKIAAKDRAKGAPYVDHVVP